MDLHLKEFGPDDRSSVETYVEIDRACLVDAPWWHPTTVYRQTMVMRHGWDGEVGRYFLIHVGDDDEAVGKVELHTSDYDNLDLAWVVLAIRPELRRRGYGTHGMQRAFDAARAMGRTKVGWFGWDDEQTMGFARAVGFEPKSVAVHRRQHLRELEPGLADRLYAEAEPHARDYELLRIEPRTGADHTRQHRLRGDLGTHRHNGKDLEQWEFEVTSGGRVRYAIDDDTRTVWVVYASPRHPKDTDA